MSRIKYPNPGFFKAKDQMDWKAQGRNMKEVAGIIGGMIKETDWKDFFGRQGRNIKDDARRIGEEFAEFAKMSHKERVDVILHGEKK
ncbi:MAG: hypothetical protein II602_02590, partial [Erysipelotrichales bacterium]|nr:hypothetical protein [Erysipelotrichales bacterium]